MRQNSANAEKTQLFQKICFDSSGSIQRQFAIELAQLVIHITININVRGTYKRMCDGTKRERAPLVGFEQNCRNSKNLKIQPQNNRSIAKE